MSCASNAGFAAKSCVTICRSGMGSGSRTIAPAGTYHRIIQLRHRPILSAARRWQKSASLVARAPRPSRRPHPGGGDARRGQERSSPIRSGAGRQPGALFRQSYVIMQSVFSAAARRTTFLERLAWGRPRRCAKKRSAFWKVRMLQVPRFHTPGGMTGKAPLAVLWLFALTPLIVILRVQTTAQPMVS
jgi:hypothetical protein